MNRILLVLAVIFCAQFSLTAQPDFQRLYKRTASAQSLANGLQLTSDGGFIMVGRDSTKPSQDYDVYLAKIAANGDTMWARSYGTSGPEYGQYAIQSQDGGYMIVGTSLNSTMDIYLVKTNSIGDTMWTRVLGDVGDDEANFVQQTNDGNFIVAGYTSSSGAGSYDYFLLKVSPSGNILWSKTYGTALDELAYSVFQSSDKGYIIAGAAMTAGGTIDMYAVKTDSMGAELWSKYYGTADTDWGYMMRPTSDGGYALTGYVGAPGGGTDAVLIKTDALGDTLWTHTYGGSNFEQGLSLIQTNSGGYALSGSVYYGGLGGSDAMLLKTDNSGNLLYCRGFGSAGDDWSPSIAQLPDNSFVLGAYSNGLNGASYNFYLVRTDTAGHTVGYCNEAFTSVQQTSAAFIITTLTTTILPFTLNASQQTTNIGSTVTQTEGCSSLALQNGSSSHEVFSMSIYPDPSAGSFSVACDKLSSSTATIVVQNMFGQQVYSETLRDLTGSIDRTIFCNDLPPGSYLLRLNAGTKTRSAKLIIIK